MNTHTVSTLKPTPLYFGHQSNDEQPQAKTDAELNAMGCCERRGHGIPVGCCDPHPQDQVVFINLPEGKTVEDYAINDPMDHNENANEKNIISRTLASITHFLKTLFGGFIADLKSIVTRNNKISGKD